MKTHILDLLDRKPGGRWHVREVTGAAQLFIGKILAASFSCARRLQNEHSMNASEAGVSALLSAHLVNVVPQVRSKLISLTTASCSCRTKAPEIEYHDPDCRYRLAMEALNLLDNVDVELAKG